MAQKKTLLQTLALQGLEIAPSQVRGSIRIVPLLRRNPRQDLRLVQRSYNEDWTIVSPATDRAPSNVKYISYVPHGLVLSWSEDGSPNATLGGQLHSDGQRFLGGAVRVMQRMVQRETKNQLRFLPLHLAMEGFLTLFFSGPAIAWSEYSRSVFSQGLGARWEMSYSGRAIAGLEDALRVFEIHSQQVGVLLFVAEALASIFIVPTPEDYRALHRSLLEDFYGELIYSYGVLYPTTYPMDVTINESTIHNLTDLRQAIAQIRTDWAEFQGMMAQGLLDRPLKSQVIYTAASFTLQRFITDLQPTEENHIGEAIVDERGTLQYLKTYRLSVAQTKRVYLLSQLASHNWNLEATASYLGIRLEELVQRFERAGFGYLLKEQVRAAARKKLKR